MQYQLNRRRFMQSSALAGAGSMLWQPSALSASPENGGEGEGWFDKPMRWAQVAFVENDPAQYDKDFWLDYFERTHSQAAVLSAGGVVAFYPTKIPLHYRSTWMEETDPFGDMVEGCRKLGMVVVARTDPHAVRQDVFDAHPDWIMRNEKGEPRRHWANPDLWVTCPYGPYNFEFMTEVHKEIMSLYKIEGIFSNRWKGHGKCFCEHCQRLFYDYCEKEIPQTSNPQDPNQHHYIVWEKKRLTDLWLLWDREVRSIHPASRFIPNGPPDLKAAGELADILIADHQARSGNTPPWSAARTGKRYRAVMGKKPSIGIFSVGLEEPYRWKDSVQSEAEIRIWVAEATASGLRPWFTKFSATLYDKRWLESVEKIYQWNAKAEPYLRNVAPLANVAVVFSEQTQTFYRGGSAQRNYGDHERGMYHALIESRIPIEMVHDQRLEPEHVDSFQLLILPNIAALSDRQCEQLRGYVERGGSLLATYETSLYNEWGHKRYDFGLSDLFGVSYGGGIEGRMQNSYLSINRDSESGEFHPILAGLQDTPRIINGSYRLKIEPKEEFIEEFPSPITLVPSYPDLPMEHVFPRIPHTDIREVYLRELGGSRITYIPWDIDRIFWEVMAVDHAVLLGNLVRWTLGAEPPVKVDGPGLVDISIWRQENSMTVHLVNLTNPMMMKGPFRELIPLTEQKVRIRLPNGEIAKRVHLLVADKSMSVEMQDGWAHLHVPSILDHEVVAIDFA